MASLSDITIKKELRLCVDPTKIQFVDETHECLLEYSKMITGKEENHD